MLAVRFVLVCREPEIIPIEIGEVHFTDKYNPEARLLIPAAYTGEDGAIEGEYRIAGKLQQCRESRYGGLRVRLVRKEKVLPDIPVQP